MFLVSIHYGNIRHKYIVYEAIIVQSNFAYSTLFLSLSPCLYFLLASTSLQRPLDCSMQIQYELLCTRPSLCTTLPVPFYLPDHTHYPAIFPSLLPPAPSTPSFVTLKWTFYHSKLSTQCGILFASQQTVATLELLLLLLLLYLLLLLLVQLIIRIYCTKPTFLARWL